jgi:hypothetical protein
MEKLYKGIFIALLTSLVIVLLVLPLLVKIGIIKDFILGLSSKEYAGLVYLILLVIILSWNNTRDLWRKYKNNYSSLKYPPFVYLDYIVLTIIFTIFLLIDLKIDFLLRLPLDLLKFLKVCLYMGAVWFFISYYLPERRDKQQVLSGVILSRTDEPINRDEQDLLGRTKFIEDLSQQIENAKFNNSFVFGLYGYWGEGKTSIINLLIKRFQKNNKFLVINFVPWHFKDSDAILSAFYKQVEAIFSKNYILPNLKVNFMKFHEIISNGFVKYGLKFNICGLNLEFSPKESNNIDTFDNINENIQSCISSSNKKVLIIIDDIDRLQTDQILLIFKLVCSNSRFQNTIFLLSMDHNATEKNISSHVGGLGKEYIAKIVQQPVVLPKIESLYLDKFLWLSDHPIPQNRISDLLNNLSKDVASVSTNGIIENINKDYLEVYEEREAKKHIIEVMTSKNKKNFIEQQNFKIGDRLYIKGSYKNKEIFIDEIGSEIRNFRLSWVDILFLDLLNEHKITNEDIKDFDHNFVHLYQSRITKLIKTLRNAKRYINSLYSSLPSIAEEVNLRDFCLLEFIKVFAGELYDDIYDNWWFYVEERIEGDALINPFTFALHGKAEEKNKLIQEHINEILENVKDHSERDVFSEILKELFPQAEEALRHGKK